MSELLSLAFKRMNLLHYFAIILVVVGVLNFVINKNNTGPAEDNIGSKVVVSEIPEAFITQINSSEVGSIVTKSNPEGFDYLFSELDVSALLLNKKIKTVFKIASNKKDTQAVPRKYLIIYEMSGGLETYLHIKSALEDKIKGTKNSIFEANNVGLYSFYYNNDDIKNTIYLVSLIKGTVFAFEYPTEKTDDGSVKTKENKKMKENIKMLVNSF